MSGYEVLIIIVLMHLFIQFRRGGEGGCSCILCTPFLLQPYLRNYLRKKIYVLLGNEIMLAPHHTDSNLPISPIFIKTGLIDTQQQHELIG